MTETETKRWNSYDEDSILKISQWPEKIWDSRYSVLDLQGLIELNQAKIQITTNMFRLSKHNTVISSFMTFSSPGVS
jgi:hypothetical protein